MTLLNGLDWLVEPLAPESPFSEPCILPQIAQGASRSRFHSCSGHPNSSVTPSDHHLPHLHLDHRLTLTHIFSQTRLEVLHEPLALLFSVEVSKPQRLLRLEGHLYRSLYGVTFIASFALQEPYSVKITIGTSWLRVSYFLPGSTRSYLKVSDTRRVTCAVAHQPQTRRRGCRRLSCMTDVIPPSNIRFHGTQNPELLNFPGEMSHLYKSEH
ncbi:hypothetical protein BDW67DRAFT_161605 [Aspergillus spinulosporus]